MSSITIKPSRSALETVDIEKAMQQGRRLRSEAFTSFLRAMFTRSKDERSRQKDDYSPDCAAPA